MSDTKIKDRWAGAIMGAFIGHALALGPRFKDRKPMKQRTWGHADGKVNPGSTCPEHLPV
ncbi:MAG: hypothetical protein WB792_01235 [Desulfobacterales bacterium]